MRAYFHRAQPREKRLRLIGAGIGVRVSEGMVDPLDLVLAMERFPVRGFVGTDRAALQHALAD